MQSRVTIQSTRMAWLFVLVTVVIHLALYKLPLINLEWSFSDAARYFEIHNQDFLERYFSVQANTLGIPLLAYLIHQLIPVLDLGIIPRVLSISGFIFMGAALIRLNDLIGRRVPPALLMAFVFLNPLIWTFGGRGTADFFPAALTLFSLSLFWDKQKKPATLAVAILTFSLAIVLKYHAVLLLPLIWLEAVTAPNVQYKKVMLRMGLMTGAVFVIPALYLYAVKQAFGFWFAPPSFQDVHHLSLAPSFVLTNFISYAGYLALLLLPLSLLPLWKHMRSPLSAAILFAAATILFLAGYGLVEPNGEMNFGPLDAYLNPHVVGGAFCLCAGLFFLILGDGLLASRAHKNTFHILLCLSLCIIGFIGILSFTRPAQRYLLFVLPLMYIFIPPALANKKLFATLVIASCVVMNVYITLNQYATGQAATELTQKILDNGLINITDPGVIDGHAGNAFPINITRDKKYIVVTGKDPARIFYAESAPAPFVHKTYSVVPEASLPRPDRR